ncbi:MAG: hypothetical protein BWY71_01345 [Planctomycetes bacterium ADurb.Bin412]|nr:MAG: hypothetical protein BWY71_01345 [Planctomycetes bacterium ADurb.Bin412]
MNAELDGEIFHDFPGEDREADPAEDDRGVAVPADGGNGFGQVGEEGFAAGPETIVHIAEGKTDQTGPAGLKPGGDGLGGMVRQA